MEKRVPHYKLSLIHQLIMEDKVLVTGSARISAEHLGIFYDDMLDVIVNLTTADFYKSMTSYADYRQWQDVYRPHTKFGDIYLKFIIEENLVIISFKEL